MNYFTGLIRDSESLKVAMLKYFNLTETSIITVDEYILKRYNEYVTKLKRLKNISDDELLKEHQTRIQKLIDSMKLNIEETKILKENVKECLRSIKSWVPPKEYISHKNEMIKEIEQDLNCNFNHQFEIETIAELNFELQKSAETIRSEEIKKCKKEIKHYREEYYQKLKHVVQQNELIYNLIESLQGF
jgi:transcriptional regulatory protein LevR